MEAVEVYDAKAIEPTQDIEQGTKAADALVKLVKKAGLAKKFGGEKEHLFVEAWEALGKFYRMSAKPLDAQPVTVEGIAGAKARAVIIDIDTGHEISGADAYCMRDEPNWRNKPFYQLASMAQTRAASKAFRMVLAFVPALAGFATTPAEEMSDMERVVPDKKEPPKNQAPKKDEPDYRAEITRMLTEMWGGDEAAMEEALKSVTGFQGKKGWVEGKSSVDDLKDARNEKGASQLTIAYNKVKEEYVTWQNQGE